jgi:NAD(P)-dependent dehydrogenase (short-subunit alcohol dehydrogenase family)
VDAGAKVALLARASAELDLFSAELGDNAVACVCDVSSSSDVRAAIATSVQRFGRLDVLVNNAAIGSPARIEKITDEHIRLEIGTNLIGPIYCIREAIPHLKKSTGHIVNISSIGVKVPFDMMGLYSTTKGGLEVLSLALHFELREHGIRMSTVRLGGLIGEKGLTRLWDKDKKREYVHAAKESGRMSMVGGFTPFQSAATAVLSVVTAPPEGNYRMVEFGGL